MAKIIIPENPCNICGSIERYKNGRCAPCSRKHALKWARNNRDKARKNTLEWQRKNPQRVGEYQKNYRDEHKEEKKLYNQKYYIRCKKRIKKHNLRYYHFHRRKYKLWRSYSRISDKEKKERRCEYDKKRRDNNPEIFREYSQRRRNNYEGEVDPSQWQALVDYYGECLCCGRSDIDLTMDHIVPISKGGTHSIDNLQPLCQSCNSAKSDKTIDYRPDKRPDFWRQLNLLDLD